MRGTVRSLARCSYLTTLFDARHGPGRFELLGAPAAGRARRVGRGHGGGVWGRACSWRGGFGVEDADTAAAEELVWQVAMLEGGGQDGGGGGAWCLRRRRAAWTPDAGKRVTLTEESWNEEGWR